MSWATGDEITAAKLNSENALISTGYNSIPINTTAVAYVVKYCWVAANTSNFVASFYCQSNDGWFNQGSEHEFSIIALSNPTPINFSTSDYPVQNAGTTTVYHATYNHHHTVTVNVPYSVIDHDGWYQFEITQYNRVGGEGINVTTYTYPQRAKVGSEIIHVNSTGNRAGEAELNAARLNLHYITTL